MGMQQAVVFGGELPAWPAVRDVLAAAGFPAQTRMIDGELSFPDEAPPPTWRELRLGTPQGMITVRREPGRVEVVTWGNADATMRQAWNAVAWAFATAGNGAVETAEGPRDAATFRRTAELPASVRGSDSAEL